MPVHAWRALVAFVFFVGGHTLTGTCADDPEVITERDVAVPMRDGVILRADVYRPSEGGPLSGPRHADAVRKIEKCRSLREGRLHRRLPGCTGAVCLGW